MTAPAAANTFTSVLQDAPDVLKPLERAHEQAWTCVEPRLLELCRLRIAQLLSNHDEVAQSTEGAGVDAATRSALRVWPTDDHFDERDRAVLAYCEQFVIDVTSMTDGLADAVRDHLGDQGLADLTASLLVVEQRQRLSQIWQRIL